MTDSKKPQPLDDSSLELVTGGTAVPPGFPPTSGNEEPFYGYGFGAQGDGPDPDDEVYPEYAHA